VADGHRVLAERVASQADAFAQWGGVVPELAARGHVAHLPGLVEEVLDEAGLEAEAVDAIAIAAWPGLMGSLLCGVTAAKTLAARWQRPLVAVDHVQAHLAAVHIGRESVPYPAVGLVASGGHSHFYRCDGPGVSRCLGGTIDDAAGEAFDKAAAILELGYPGGPTIDCLAAEGDPKALALPRSFLRSGDLRLSFAGLKTALLYKVRGPMGKEALRLDDQGLRDACASFQQAVVDVLCAKLILAAEQEGVTTLFIGGGVACNRGLRQAVEAACAERGWTSYQPAPRHCADNAAMVAALGYQRSKAGDIAGLDLRPLPSGRAGPRA
jgi:N6-L-threonylcarbamoyladenine synthase